MAANLQKNGHSLVVFNRTRAKAEPLLGPCGTFSDSPAKLAEQVDVLFTMLAHPDAVEQAALGANGFLNHLRPNALWVDCSSVNPSFSKKMAAEAARARDSFRRRAGDRLRSRCCGSESSFFGWELIRRGLGNDSLRCCCAWATKLFTYRRTRHGDFNENGSQSVSWVTPWRRSPKAWLWAKGSESRAKCCSIHCSARLRSHRFWRRSGRKSRAEITKPNFRCAGCKRIMHLASVSAYESGVAIPVTNVTKEIYRLAMRGGHGTEDFSAIYEFATGDNEKEPKAQL